MIEGISPAQWLSAGSQVLTGALGTKPAGPSTAVGSVDIQSWFDGSGWTVATGGSTARGGDRAQSTPIGDMSAWMPLLIIGSLAGLYIFRS